MPQHSQQNTSLRRQSWWAGILVVGLIKASLLLSACDRSDKEETQQKPPSKTSAAPLPTKPPRDLLEEAINAADWFSAENLLEDLANAPQPLPASEMETIKSRLAKAKRLEEITLATTHANSLLKDGQAKTLEDHLSEMKKLTESSPHEQLDRLSNDLDNLKNQERERNLEARAAKLLTAITSALDDNTPNLAQVLLNKLREDHADQISYGRVAKLESRLLSLDRTTGEDPPKGIGIPPPNLRPRANLEETAGMLIKKYVLASSSTSNQSQLEFYAPKVDFFQQGEKTFAEIKPILERYRRNNTTRVENLKEAQVVTLRDGSLSGSITYDYHTSNKNSSTSRRITNSFILKSFGKDVLITDVKILKSVPLQPPPAANNPIEARIEVMLQKYYKAGSTGEGLAQIQYFAPSSSYFAITGAKHADIRTNLKNYHANKPWREFKFTKIRSLKPTGKRYVVIVEFQFRSYATKNEFNRSKFATGTNEVFIIFDGNSPRITSIK